MAFLRELAFSFARFVAREHRRRRFSRRAFNLVAARRWNSGHRHQRRLDRLRRRGNYSAPQGSQRRHGHDDDRYGPGGRRLHGNRLNGNRSASQRHNRNRSFGASTRPVPREQNAVAVAEPTVVAAPEVAAPEDTVPEELVDGLNRTEASASNDTADVDDLMPPPPAFAVPPMEWLLGGPSSWLVDDDADADDFGNYFMRHGSGPCLPSPTPSDEDMQHFAPPGYDPVPEFTAPPDVVQPEAVMEEVEAVAPALAAPMLPDLNLPLEAVEEEENKDAAPVLTLPTPSPEARVLLRRFAAAMAARPAGIRAGTWSPEALGLTANIAENRHNEASTSSPSPSGQGPSRR